MNNTTKTILYWACQVIGWGAQIFLLNYFSFKYESPETNLSKIIALNVIIGFSGLSVSHSIRNYFKRNLYKDQTLLKLIPRVIVICMIGALVMQFAVHAAMLTFLDWERAVRPIVWSDIPTYFFNSTWLLVIWSVIYFGFQFFENARESKIEKLQARSALKDAELIALKAQVNPHFLFNSLNNIKALILLDPDKARNMLTNLSDLLRYSIDFNKQKQVTIQEEVEIVKYYLELEMAQYDDRLTYAIEVDEHCQSVSIPPMIIQTLVENAIKHGISQIKSGGEVFVHIASKMGETIIKVSNTGKLNQTKHGTHVGIKNMLERIRIMFDTEPTFSLTEKDNLVVASLIIPTPS